MVVKVLVVVVVWLLTVPDTAAVAGRGAVGAGVAVVCAMAAVERSRLAAVAIQVDFITVS
jgi:hypothetical protein